MPNTSRAKLFGYSMRGDNNAFFMDRVFQRMGRVMSVDDAVNLMK